MRFIFDENLPQAIMDMVSALSSEDGQADEFIHVVARWGRGARDTTWLPAAASEADAQDEPTLILTRDTGRKEEREAWQSNPIPVLCLHKGWKGWTYKQIAVALVSHWDSIRSPAPSRTYARRGGLSRRGDFSVSTRTSRRR